MPKQVLYEATKAYATNSPGSAIQWGLPIDQAPDGVHVAQAITDIWAITGNIDVPGGQVIAGTPITCRRTRSTTTSSPTCSATSSSRRSYRSGSAAEEYGWLRKWRCYIQPDVAVQQMLTQKPYPIRATWIQTSNPVANAADQKTHYEALKAMDFNVVVDLFHNPTTMACADIVLPAATFAERTGFRAWFEPVQVIQAGGPGRRVQERLGHRLRHGGGASIPISRSASRTVSPTTWTGASSRRARPTRAWSRRAAGNGRRDNGDPGIQGPVDPVLSLQDRRTARRRQTGVQDPFRQDRAVVDPERGMGRDRRHHGRSAAALPGAGGKPAGDPRGVQEVPVDHDHRPGAAPVYFHAEHRNIPWLRELDPWPDVEIHPTVARDLKVEEGEWVFIENDRGRIRRKVKIDSRHPSQDHHVPARVVAAGNRRPLAEPVRDVRCRREHADSHRPSGPHRLRGQRLQDDAGPCRQDGRQRDRNALQPARRCLGQVNEGDRRCRRKRFLADMHYCTGCHACEVACKQENQHPVGISGIKIIEVIMEDVAHKRVHYDYVPHFSSNCNLCAPRIASGEDTKPACVKHCGTASLQLRNPGGVGERDGEQAAQHSLFGDVAQEGEQWLNNTFSFIRSEYDRIPHLLRKELNALIESSKADDETKKLVAGVCSSVEKAVSDLSKYAQDQLVVR